MTPVLRAEGLHVLLGRRAALAGVDAVLEPGRFTVVVGPNGAGKTTLLRALAGLVPLSKGHIVLGARPLRSFLPTERARTIAYLPQNGTIAWPLPVQDVVALGRMPHGEKAANLPAEGETAVTEAIAAAGLRGFEMRSATELSGGERARVLLARALATKAPVLLVDEPVAALDPRHQLLVLDILRVRARGGATVVAVMHDLALAARYADRMLLMQEGRLVAEGLPEEVLTPARLAASFGIEATVTRREDALIVTPWRALR